MDRYGLTTEGKAINVDTYCLRLANNADTYVQLFMDYDQENEVKEEHIDWNSLFNDLVL